MNILAEEASDGLEALSKIEERFECPNCSKFIVVFMDLMMPNMDGFETCSNLLEMFDSVTDLDKTLIPNIIICSAHDEESIRNSLNRNYLVKNFIPKPVGKSKIEKIISKFHI